MEDDFLRLCKKCTIEELHETKEDGFFVLSGTISEVLQEGPWWYSGCSCGKSLRPRSGAYYCDGCQNYYTQVTPRYRVTVCVSSETSQGIFVLFDREAAHLLIKSCLDLFKEVQVLLDSPLKEAQDILSEVLETGYFSSQNFKVEATAEKRPVKRSLLVEFDSEDDDEFVPAYKVQKTDEE